MSVGWETKPIKTVKLIIGSRCVTGSVIGKIGRLQAASIVSLKGLNNIAPVHGVVTIEGIMMNAKWYRYGLMPPALCRLGFFSVSRIVSQCSVRLPL